MEDLPDGRDPGGVSRRMFLKGVGVSALAAGTWSGAEAQAAPPPALRREVRGPGAVKLRLLVNGRERALEVEPRVTLLDALRNHLGLTGAKKVCDRATCGACTVLVEGRPAYACSLLAIEAEGRRIETVESVGDPELSALQAAFVEHDGQQCGFCTPGFVMACEGFLRRNGNRNLSPEEAREHLGGNLCRCGTYAGITQAVIAAAKGGR